MAKPAYIVLASTKGRLLASFGPYRSSRRATQVREAIYRAALGADEPVQAVSQPFDPGVLTPAQAADYIGRKVWGDVWTEGSTSDEEVIEGNVHGAFERKRPEEEA